MLSEVRLLVVLFKTMLTSDDVVVADVPGLDEVDHVDVEELDKAVLVVKSVELFVKFVPLSISPLLSNLSPAASA